MPTDNGPAPLFLCAPVNALVEGIYEEKIPFSEIKRHGDFGLGTFDHLDGEMVMLDGEVFQVTAEGRVMRVADDALTPFSCVTFFRAMMQDELSEECAYPEFLAWLERLLPSPNLCYALRIDGEFSQVRVRSVPKQESYRPLVEVAKEQPVFTFENLRGTLVGFYTPAFMASLNVPGLHLHFLSEDRCHGGHLLECRPRAVNMGIQFISRVELSLPMSLDYLTCDFERDIHGDLEQAEK